MRFSDNCSTKKRVSLLGATGSIGSSAFDVMTHHRDCFDVVAVSAQKNVQSLAKRARILGADLAVIGDERLYGALKEALQGTSTICAAGEEALLEAARASCDITIVGIGGLRALAPVREALGPGKILGLANKECLVAAGTLLMAMIQKTGTVLIPLDSEHSALFDILGGHRLLKRGRGVAACTHLTLTASGGPFLKTSLERLPFVTPQDALAHPTWSMGKKITVDSATMMNKALEVIEAHTLFMSKEGEKEERESKECVIDVLIHPQSLVHGLVTLLDGTTLMHASIPDMRIPIAKALFWPRMCFVGVKAPTWQDLSSLTFEPPDLKRFPALKLGFDALKEGCIFSTALNASNEVAVESFLSERIGFLDVVTVVQKVLEGIDKLFQGRIQTFGDVIHIDSQARSSATRFCQELAS